MIHFTLSPEPPDFDQNARRPGQAWLTHHTDQRPTDLWSAFKGQLAEGFGSLCAYSVMYEPVGTLDHYLSCENHRELAYEWGNYRYASAWVNSSKGTLDDQVLDPFEVQDGWFEIILPSLQLVVTEAVPPRERAKAEFTLKRLHLQDDERVIRQRREWYRLYQEGKLTLAGLEEKAPLIARAIRKQS